MLINKIFIDLSTYADKILCVLQQGESNGRQLVFHITNEGKNYFKPPDSALYKLQIDKPDGTTVMVDNTAFTPLVNRLVIAEQNPLQITYTVNKNVCAVEGTLQCKLSIVTGEAHDTIRTVPFKMRVAAGVKAEEDIVSTNEYHRFEDFIDKIDQQVPELIDTMNESIETMKQVETNVNKSAQAAESAKNAAAQSEQNAAESEQNAAKSKDDAFKLAGQAKQKVDESAYYSSLSQSYAIGTENTIRENDSTDNAKNYCKLSESSSKTAQEYLGYVEEAGEEVIRKLNEAIDLDSPHFQMDLSTGHLMYTGGRFDFQVNANGHLEWRLAI